jgi:hypothetical protein
MKRVLSLVALLGLAALLFVAGRWILNSDPGAANAAQPQLQHEAAPASAAAPELDELSDTSGASTEAPLATAGRRESEVRSPDGDAKLARAERSVSVLDATTRLPVAGVEVRYEALAAHQAHAQHPAWSANSLAAWLARDVAATKSDAAGHAELDTPPSAGCVVIAHTPGFIGRAHFAAGEEGVKPLELASDAHLDVLALGPDGGPLAGVPVALRNRVQGHVSDKRVWTTNSEGRTRFEHLGLDVGFEARSSAWSLAIVGLLDERAEFALDPKAWPVETVKLHACPSGAVELSVLDVLGAPLASGKATLGIAGVDDDRSSFWASREETETEVAEGRARFPLVRLGASLEAHVTAPGAPAPVKKKFDGPRVAGEVVRAELRVGAEQPVLRARLLGEAGALANKSIDWSLELRWEWSTSKSNGRVAADADGVVLVALPDRWLSGSQRILQFRIDGDGPLRRARVDLSRELAPGVHDFGDLRLEPLPVLVSGRVVDAHGKPAAQARIHAQAARADETPRGAMGRDRFDSVVDANGEFELRGDAEASRLTLSATTKTARAAEFECAVGARDVVLTLLEGGRIEGALQLDPGVAPNSINVHVLRESVEAGSEDGDDYARVSNDGRFEALQLDPGRYRLRVQVANTEVVLVELEGLYVPADGACEDPRLASIDLRGRLTAIRIEMTPPLPHERVVGQVFATPLDNPGAPLSVMFHDRSVALCVVGRGADLVIAAAGYKTVPISGASGDVKVKLERGPKVRLRLAAGVELPAPPRHLKACLNRPGGQATMLGHFQESVFDSQGELVVYASGAGEFEVEWMLEERTPNSLTTQSLEATEVQRIEVLDAPGEQVFVVHAPKDALAEALEAR